ncbi:glycosyltransferase family 4 protein [Methylomonas sp. SURF-1]|uniref:Glycosyltransferase family 4 protein n=1 Tax=Methylomonas aurea TaxID=2952224 RepID=A0ABT1ULQ2_9GAMM|nr:glycosyltransferase family 4 protein [Methylomonas sp. SURF-1]MCQ8183167.1 glycosyltransferase family 4 protein [Methylomonas sp. SURF-1]
MKILIFQPMLKQYRMPLFELMGEMLGQSGHELRVVCGTPPVHERNKGDNVLVSSGYCVVDHSLWLFSGKLHILPSAVRHIVWADFVITEQANKHFHNYLLMLMHWLGCKRFAYWGHGQNRQGDPHSFRERIKKILSTQVDWWFAYTSGVAEYIAGLGYPKAKITILNNSIDTSCFKEDLAAHSGGAVDDLKVRLKIPRSARVGLYCGGLYSDKKLRFLLDAAIAVKEVKSDFILLVVGDGVDRKLVEDYSRQYEFIKYLGPLFGADKALIFRVAEVFLCPGLVGLAILDAFSAGLPLLTTDIPNHSPEIEYLEHGINGMITAPDIKVYSAAVCQCFGDGALLSVLKKGALESSARFSIENMASNFVDGILRYLGSA